MPTSLATTVSDQLFTIRPANAADSPEAVKVVKAVFDEYHFTWDPTAYCADLYDLEKHYLKKGHGFWIALREGEAMGTVALRTFPLVPGADGGMVKHNGVLRVCGCDASLDRLYVMAPARRHGIGTALFETVLQSARDRNCRALEIWSDKRFTEAHKLYSRYGAQVVGDRICHDPDASPEWGLVLPLT